MPDLKLPKLPDRTPVKIAITVSPEISAMLTEYAEFYAQTYGTQEPIAELCPFILQAFLESDRAFLKARRRNVIPALPRGETPRRRGGRRSSTQQEGQTTGA
jgi:hypothetical protein